MPRLMATRSLSTINLPIDGSSAILLLGSILSAIRQVLLRVLSRFENSDPVAAAGGFIR